MTEPTYGLHERTARYAGEPSAEADAALIEGVVFTALVERKVPQRDQRHIMDKLRAALSRPATPPLDVELLRQAMDRVGVTLGDDRRYAAIAREYAALANPTPEDT